MSSITKRKGKKKEKEKKNYSEKITERKSRAFSSLRTLSSEEASMPRWSVRLWQCSCFARGLVRARGRIMGGDPSSSPIFGKVTISSYWCSLIGPNSLQRSPRISDSLSKTMSFEPYTRDWAAWLWSIRLACIVLHVLSAAKCDLDDTASVNSADGNGMLEIGVHAQRQARGEARNNTGGAPEDGALLSEINGNCSRRLREREGEREEGYNCPTARTRGFGHFCRDPVLKSRLYREATRHFLKAPVGRQRLAAPLSSRNDFGSHLRYTLFSLHSDPDMYIFCTVG